MLGSAPVPCRRTTRAIRFPVLIPQRPFTVRHKPRQKTLPDGLGVACTPHEGRMREALGWLCGSLVGALWEPWGSLGVALGCLSLGYQQALRWLCTPESMPSIWPCGGLVVALGG